MLASLAAEVPHGEGWTYEVKFDGFRALAYLRGGECELRSRNDKDLTERFAEIAKAIVKAVKTPNAVLDGEICRIDPSGRSSFSELQQGDGPLVFFAFDLLEEGGESKVDLPLHERKAQLRDAARPACEERRLLGGLRRRRRAARGRERAGARRADRQARSTAPTSRAGAPATG